MERWTGRVAVVTGASMGIGAAIAQELVKKGLNVVGLARRLENFEGLLKTLESEKGKLHPMKCDITNETEVKNVFQRIKDWYGRVDILVNNAGTSHESSLIDGETHDWKCMLDLNVLGLSMCTKEALKIMNENKVEDGHIIHINSIAGHTRIPVLEVYAMYCASKNAVTVLTEGLRLELIKKKSKIRVTSISPGVVKTSQTQREFLKMMPYLEPKDIADGVLYALGTPPHVQIHEMIIKPVGEVF
ncbi:hypothetical protein L9F63_004103 [Diploptera punctata]|uniref:Farnesol dehydrogenase n=1 Tax=Diploptera punctata TaxID=6984 RepID=A0AAD7ZH58_DIPPU|nr:hypothetical protein L9F63_004103 [Diploptera punctata]